MQANSKLEHNLKIMSRSHKRQHQLRENRESRTKTGEIISEKKSIKFLMKANEKNKL